MYWYESFLFFKLMFLFESNIIIGWNIYVKSNIINLGWVTSKFEQPTFYCKKKYKKFNNQLDFEWVRNMHDSIGK